MKISTQLTRWQKRHKLTDTQAAEIIGTKRKTWADWRSGAHKPNAMTLYVIGVRCELYDNQHGTKPKETQP